MGVSDVDEGVGGWGGRDGGWFCWDFLVVVIVGFVFVVVVVFVFLGGWWGVSSIHFTVVCHFGGVLGVCLTIMVVFVIIIIIIIVCCVIIVNNTGVRRCVGHLVLFFFINKMIERVLLVYI